MITAFISFIVTFLMVLTFTFWISAYYRNKERNRVAAEKSMKKEKETDDEWESIINDFEQAEKARKDFDKPVAAWEMQRFLNFMLTNGIIDHKEYTNLMNRAYPYVKG